LCHLRDNTQKYGTVGQATGDNVVHVVCMLDN